MLLHVFNVDIGDMLVCEVTMTAERVHHLKEYIERTYNIPYDKQVLLINGGQALDPEYCVGGYSCGIDTNPIFLFNKSVIEATTPPKLNVQYKDDAEFIKKVREATADMPADYATIDHRTDLALELHKLARAQSKLCKDLVYQQHLQQQGWSAVMANLEDIIEEFKKRADLCAKQFNVYMQAHKRYVQCLQSFHEDLGILSRIPLLPVLLENDETLEESQIPADSKSEKDVESKEDDNKMAMTLLEWISASDDKSSVEQLYEMCSRGLQSFDQNVYNAMRLDIENAMADADNKEMKEIKGIENRLSGLEELLKEAEKYLHEQGELAGSIHQNRLSAKTETSVFPELCTSHRQQLLVMLQNHQQLCDIRRRCINAKEELAGNLFVRLKWVMYIENSILETSHRLFIYHENLKRLRKHLEVLEQIHLAPATYLSAVAEVVRRKTYSRAFLTWASEIACHLLTIQNNEIATRNQFRSKFEGHFLNSLFPGMDDLPPAFAAQAPAVFDSNLPNVTNEDVEYLKDTLPDLAENTKRPNLSSVLKFFDSNLDSKFDKEEADRVEELVQAVQDMGLSTNTEQNLLKTVEPETLSLIAQNLPHLKDLDRCCESETDTEEFEKVCQSPLDIHFDKDIPSPRTKTQDVATSTEDNLQTSRTEYDRLKGVLHRLAEIIRQTLPNLKSELSTLRNNSLLETEEIVMHYERLSESIEQMNHANCLKEREIIERLTFEHQLELGEYKQALVNKTEEIKCLRNENTCLDQQINTYIEDNMGLKDEIKKLMATRDKEIEELQRNFHKVEQEKERMIKEIKESLIREHRAELDNLRSRFKLMMDQSPTELSQDKMDQFESMKAEAVETAISDERHKWEHVLKDTIAKITKAKDEEKHILEKENEEKDRILTALKLEISHLKESHENDSITETKKTDEMAASVGLFDGRVDAATSPVKHQEQLSRSQLSLIKLGKVSVTSCVPGDIVLVLWEPSHENYKIYQESNTMYFLHSDCVETLSLKKTDNEEQKLSCIGQVTNKEYCHARKAQNRYKVPIGTKFYRVTVKPYNLETITSSRQLLNRMSESQPQPLPSAYQVQSDSSTSQSTLARSRSTMESVIVTNCTPESSQNELLSSSASTRSQTFTYILNDTWIVGSPWILENS